MQGVELHEGILYRLISALVETDSSSIRNVIQDVHQKGAGLKESKLWHPKGIDSTNMVFASIFVYTMFSCLHHGLVP